VSITDAPTAPSFDRAALAEELLDAAFVALRIGGFEDLVAAHARAARWMVRRHLPVLRSTLGDDAAAGAALHATALLLLRWALACLRPDRAPHLDALPEAAWTELPSWRPLLAVLCQTRLSAVPAFPARYRRRPDESAVDNLCGLWDVGPSSFYRYIERARRRLAQIATGVPDAAARLSLRAFVVDAWGPPPALRMAWHAQRAALARQADPVGAVWHAMQAGEVAAAVEVLRAAAPALAGEPETDALLAGLDAGAQAPAQRVDLLLVQAVLARTRQEPEREGRTLEQALQVAQEADDARLLGAVYGELGRFHEPRNSDRAFAAYEDSLKYLQAADPGDQNPALRTLRLTSLVRLAWMQVVRDHPRAKEMLEGADALRRRHGGADDLVGLLEQSWGEYWRRAGNHQRALQARHRALNAFERINDRRSVLVTYLNLILLHGDACEEAQALDYAQRVFTVAQATAVEPAILVSTYGNLGVAHARVHHYPAAIEAFGRALDLATVADLRLHANRMRLNLASAHFGLFVQTRDPEHERLGDTALAAVLQAPPSETTPSLVETAKGLKAEVLGEMPDRLVDRLLDDESAAHLAEMAEIGRRRAALKRDHGPAQALRDRFEIAAAYVRIAARERDAAVRWARGHGLAEHVPDELARLDRPWIDGADPAQALAAAWRGPAGDLIDDRRRQAVAERLLGEGELSKASYGEAAAVSPATASKHLALLTQRGLLVQTGRGPATRYRLPEGG
jgi:tetratricopeptide (TPR) repeat protein